MESQTTEVGCGLPASVLLDLRGLAHIGRQHYLKKNNRIIEGCIKNDRRSQNELYNQFFDVMMSICMRYCKDEDLAMETLNLAFMKVLKNLESYNSKYELKPWIAKITANEAIDAYRKKIRRREFIDENEDELENVSADFDSADSHGWEEAEYLEHLMECLKDSEKMVFNLYAVDGFSHKEIGDMMGITERSSIRHLTNARRKLQERLPAPELGIKKA